MNPSCIVTDFARVNRRSSTRTGGFLLPMLLMLAMVVAIFMVAACSVSVVRADNFTDIFYTNSFRGAFSWVKKLDWVGMIVQMVISCFSLFGVALLTIRIMTSMLYLSAKGMWEEVHDLKSAGGESEKDFLGLFGMAKSWAKGKSGTGLDAVVGAVLMLLPDVKKYSDFGEKAGGDFSDDMSISQYMLKIALPTIMTVFFFAMGFNGTLFQALAVTVDAMGTVADRAVSVNYSGFVDDLINSGTGYQFVFSAAGTNEGKLQQQVAKDVYGRCVSQVKDANPQQLYAIGQNVEGWVSENVKPDSEAVSGSSQISAKVKEGLGGDAADQYMSYLGYDIVINGNSEATSGEAVWSLGTDGALSGLELTDAAAQRPQYLHLFIKQTRDSANNYFNTDEIG